MSVDFFPFLLLNQESRFFDRERERDKKWEGKEKRRKKVMEGINGKEEGGISKDEKIERNTKSQERRIRRKRKEGDM